MPSKPKILFIGDYCRTDYLYLLNAAKDDCDLRLLYYASPSEEQNKKYQTYGKPIYWADYKSAQELLAAFQPSKVLFLYIDLYHTVALNMACKNAGIPTFHLEHGMRADYATSYSSENSPKLNQKPLRKLTEFAKLLAGLRARIKTRAFLTNTIKYFNTEDAAFLRKFIAVRKRNNYIETFKQLPSSKRKADYYISFSPKVYQTHQHYDKLGPHSESIFYRCALF